MFTKKNHVQTSQLSLLFVLPLVLLFLIFVPKLSDAQVNLNPETFFAAQINAQAGESVYRIHWYTNNGTTALSSASLSLEHLTSPTPPNSDLTFTSVHVRIGTVNLNGTSPAYNYNTNPLTGSLASTTVLPTAAVSGYFTSPTQVLPNFSLPAGQSIYIIEEFSIVNCSSGFTQNIGLRATFSSSTQNSIFIQSGNIDAQGVTLPALGVNWITNPVSGTVSTQNTLATGASCSNQVTRRMQFEIQNEPVTDPFFTFRLHTNDELQLLEADPASIRISLSLITAQNGTPIVVNDILLSDLLTDAAPTFANNFSLVTLNAPIDGVPLSTVPSNLVADPVAPHITSPQLVKAVNRVTLKPSLLDNGSMIFHDLVLNLSNLYAQAANGSTIDTRSTFGTSAPYNFLTLFPGSKITVTYTGTWMNEQAVVDAGSTNSSHFEEIPRLHTEIYSVRGIDPCFNSWGRGTGNEVFGYAKPRFDLEAEAGTMLSGSSDGDYMDWDGELTTMHVDMPSANILQGLRADDPLIVNWQASLMEFEIELDRGLSIPCPNTPANTISGLSNTPTLPPSCAGNAPQFGSPGITYNDGLGSSIDCGLTNSVFGLAVEPKEVFYISLVGGDTIFADAISIEPLDLPNTCNSGQKWRVQIPMNRFWRTTINSAGTVVNTYLLGNAKLNFRVQAYCPAMEPTLNYRVKAYIIPAACTNGSAPATVPNPNPSITYRHYSCGSQTANACSPTLADANQENRWLVGKTEATWLVTCPGCVTPGLVVEAEEPQRHADFIGWLDANDDGRADISGGLPQAANLNQIDRNVVRHGDVLSFDLLSYLYDPAPGDFSNDDLSGNCISGNPDEFSTVDLANPGGTGLPLLLDKWVFEMTTTTPGAGLASSARQLLYPLVQNSTPSGAVATRLFEANDDLNYGEYLVKAGQYPSLVHIRYEPVPGIIYAADYPLKESDLVWLTTSKLRIALDLNTLYTALVQQTPSLPTTYPTHFTGSEVWKLDFKMQFMMDVDHSAYEGFFSVPISQDVNIPGEKRVVLLDNKMYATDAPLADLLRFGSGLSAVILNNHPAEWEEARHIDCNGNLLAGTRLRTEWWCEASRAKFYVVGYNESRWMSNQNPFGSADIGFESTTFLGSLPLSPCTEVGPIMHYRTGNRGDESSNYFTHEIRPGALADSVVFYIPEQFVPEAVYINNFSAFLGNGAYEGTTGRINERFIIQLAGPGALVSGANPFGITITGGHTMPDAFFPRYPVTPTNQPLGGSAVSGDPIFALPTEAEKVRHLKIAIPLRYVHYSGTLPPPNTVLNGAPLTQINSSTPTLPLAVNSFPLFIGDENQQLTAVIYYSPPLCTSSSEPPYTEDCDFYNQNNDAYYYDGVPTNLLQTNINDNSSPKLVRPVVPNGAGSHVLALSDFTNITLPQLHPSFTEFKLLMPSKISSHPLSFANQTITTISTDVPKINNHRLNFGLIQDPATRNHIQNLFRGTVPAMYVRSSTPMVNASQNFGYLFFDKRANLTLTPSQDVSAEVNASTGIFSFEFTLSDELINQFSSIVAPCDVYSTIPNFHQTLTPFPRWNSNVVQRLLHRIDLSGLYFYLEPNGNSPANLFENIEIVSIEGIPFAGSGITAEASSGPRLFSILPDIPSALLAGDNPRDISVTARFNCNDPALFAQLNLINSSSDITFPFDIVVNYNCNRDLKTWRPGTVNPNPANELTLSTSQSSRCSNDRLLSGYSIVAPTFGYEVSIQPALASTPCNPLYNVLVSNQSNATLTINQLNLSGFTQTLITPTAPNNELLVGQTLTFGPYSSLAACSASSAILSASVQAEAFCAACEPSPYDQYCLLEEATFDPSLSPTSLVITSITAVPANCGSTGSVSANATGGCGTLTYEWFTDTQHTISIGIGANLTNLPAGTYYLRVTDANGCFVESNVSVVSQGGQTAFVAALNCNQEGTRFVTLTSTLGTAPFTYFMDGVQLPNASVAVSPGTSPTFWIVDANGCISPVSTITVPTAALTVTSVLTQPSCAPNNDGAIDITVSGGSLPHDFSWSSPNGFTSVQEDITQLDPGVYNLLLSDSWGCTNTFAASLVYAGEFSLSSTVTDVGCEASTAGAIEITVSGTPSQSYVYNLNNMGDVSISLNPFVINNLGSGTHQMVVSNQLGCTATINFTVGINPMNVQLTAIAPTCTNTANGAVELTIQGGTAPYSASSIGNPTTLSGLAAGIHTYGGFTAGAHTILVSDANGCSVETNVTVAALEQVAFNLDLNCNREGTRFVTLTPTSGTAPFTYFMNGVQLPGASVTVSPGTSPTFWIVDANGCISPVSTVTVPTAALTVTSVLTQPSCAPNNDGAIDITASGGSLPYDFSWSSPNGFTSVQEDISQLDPGVYNLLLSDSWGCTKTFTASLAYSEKFSITTLVTDVGCDLSTAGSVKITLGGNQSPTYVYDLNNTGGVSVSLNPFVINGLGIGNHQVVVSNQLGCTATANFIVGLNPMSIQHTAISPTCSNSSNGAVVLTIQGGTAPYSVYTVSGNPPALSGLSAGTHTYGGFTAGTHSVLIRDAGGCEQAVTFSIRPATRISVMGLQTIYCKGDPKGMINLVGMVVGGTQPYTVNFANQQQTPGLDGIFTFTGVWANQLFPPLVLTITDANGCVLSFSPSLTPVTTANTPIIGNNSYSTGASCGQADGKITINYATIGGPSAPTPLFSIDGGLNWQTSRIFTGLASGVYFVRMAYQIMVNGRPSMSPCYDEMRFVVDQEILAISIQKIKHSKFFCGMSKDCSTQTNSGTDDGEITLNYTGGQAPYTILAWKNGVQQLSLVGVTTQSHLFSSLEAGVYEFQVIDAFGCISAKITQVIGERVSFTESVSTSSAGINYSVSGCPCPGAGTYSVAVYQFQSNGGLVLIHQQSVFLNTSYTFPIPSGSYSVVTTDCNGCVHVVTLRYSAVTSSNMPQQISDTETRNEEFEPCTAQLFPNPGSERVFIRYQLDCQAETGTFRIFDNTGKLIQEAVFSDKSGTYELDTEHLPGGIYPVQISTNSGYFWHEKLVLLR